MSTKTLILDHKQIMQKFTRLAWQVYENNYNEKDLVIIGIRERGTVVADLLGAELRKICDANIHIAYLELNRNEPQKSEIQYSNEIALENKAVLLVDDVLNTGKTLMEATIPILSQNVASLQTVILANRDHKKFAIAADYVGISLATTLQEHITFTKSEDSGYSVWLS